MMAMSLHVHMFLQVCSFAIHKCMHDPSRHSIPFNSVLFLPRRKIVHACGPLMNYLSQKKQTEKEKNILAQAFGSKVLLAYICSL
jgi:hypothetical protein